MKKLLFTIVAILLPMMASALCPAEYQEYDAYLGGIYYKFYNDEASVTRKERDFKSYSGDVVIPPTVTAGGKTYYVTSIDISAFLGCDGLTSVTFPYGLKCIHTDAFRGCTNLTSITIPQSVETIDAWAFCGCTKLSTINIEGSFSCQEPHDIFAIFDNDCPITTINIPDIETWLNINWYTGLTDTHLSYHLYIKGVEVKDLVIPDGTTSIPRSAFHGCAGLTSVTLPESVRTIDIDAFKYCSGLTSISIGKNIESIGRDAFEGCSQLEDFYCYAVSNPEIKGYGGYIGSMGNTILHVPAQSVSVYGNYEPWNGFKEIVPISGAPTTLKCAKPTINVATYAGGSGFCPIIFNCATSNVVYHYTITYPQSVSKTWDPSKDANPEDNPDPRLNVSTISVYASKPGFENSETATMTVISGNLIWGDVNGDGEVNVADHVELSKIILAL